MLRVLIILTTALTAHAAVAREGGAYEFEARNDLRDFTSLHRGVRLFANYCVGCHSASYMRYIRIAKDLRVPEKLVEANLMFPRDKIGDTMRTAMLPGDSERWFGVAPPDLSVIARSRGTAWLYTFLISFYIDESRPTGVNNIKFPDTAMPHVLWELQGLQRAVFDTVKDPHGEDLQVFRRFEPVTTGQRTAAEYEHAVRDLVNFLDYVGEPAKLVRYRIGFWVIAFLLIFLVATYLLKREYWKDVH